MNGMESDKSERSDSRRIDAFAHGCGYGLVAGVSLAAAEVFCLGCTGSSLPWAYLAFAAMGDILLLGIVGGILGICANPGKDDGTWIALLGSAVIFVYGAHVLLHLSGPLSTVSTGFKIVAVSLWCVCCIVAGLTATKWTRFVVRGPLGIGFVMSMVVGCFGMVGALYINKVYLPGFFDLSSLVANGMLAVVIAGSCVLGYRYLSTRQKVGGYGTRSGVWLLLFAAIVSAAAAPVKKRASAPPLTEQVDRRSKAVSASMPSVLLICLDTVRADHLSAYGYRRPTTPELDRLCEDSEVYSHAVSTTSWTLPAHASVFTGLMPTEHGADFARPGYAGAHSRNTTSRLGNLAPALPLSDSATTLAEVLTERGYTCGAIVANCAYLWRGFQLDQGFGYYDDRRGFYVPCRPAFDLRRVDNLAEKFEHELVWYRDAAEITDDCITWMHSHSDSPWFLFANYMDTHSPYAPAAELRGFFRQEPEDPSATDISVEAAVMKQEAELTEAQRNYLVNRYDEELRYVDQEVGRLVGWLKEAGLYEDTLIVVFSDHGESFGGHSYLKHSGCLYEQEIWVPLIIKYPGSAKQGKIPRTVSLVDVPNIVLGTIGLPQIAGQTSRSVISELYVYEDRVRQYGSRFNRVLRCIYRNGKKYIWSSNGNFEVYDIETDPSETRNLADQLQDEVTEVSAQLERYVQLAQDNRLHDAGRSEVTGEMLERLRTTGYLR